MCACPPRDELAARCTGQGRSPGSLLAPSDCQPQEWHEGGVGADASFAIADSTPENLRHGDAAFADYLINFGVAWRISKKEPAEFNSL